MEIEIGDYFVVKREHAYRDTGSFFFASMFGYPHTSQERGEPQYDRSWDGIIFICRGSECGMVIGEVVHQGPILRRELGLRAMFNQDEVVLETVSKSFAAQLGVQVATQAEIEE